MKMSSIINSKGQIVIPANLRKRYGLKEGATVVCFRRTVAAWYSNLAITPRSMLCKAVLRIFRSKRIWLTKDKRSGSERTDGERIRSGCQRGAPLFRC
jgi:AbrB family looped-hinge helix DNA binding protein